MQELRVNQCKYYTDEDFILQLHYRKSRIHIRTNNTTATKMKKTITLLAFIGFLIGLFIGAFVARDQKLSEKAKQEFVEPDHVKPLL